MLADKDPLNVIITGVGGQGNLFASQILGRMLLQEGYCITVGETLGLSQRGGSVMSHIRATKGEPLPPLIPEGLCHLVLALEPTEGVRILKDYGNPEVLTITNTRPIMPLDVLAGNVEYPELEVVLQKLRELSRRVWTVDATDMALNMGDPIFANVIMLGALDGLGIFPGGRAEFKNAIKKLIPAKAMAVNLKAFDHGKRSVKEL
ncbi:MAG: indolepyruvate ferredoxin oxidoreductase [Proteobacteria bacterium]|nr:indolepyruvate ferredoxin oxidoreductase [Pseudomonadota bacterium]